jgi:hypothetical protein
MVCWHRRYTLGDEQPKIAPDEWYAASIEDDPQVLILPLYLYDHSGITISCSAFSCPWDSGQVGYVVADGKAFNDAGLDKGNKADRAKMIEILTAEVACYDSYLTGDVWGFVLETITTCDHGDAHADTVDSCWGFIGSDGTKEAIGEHLPSELQGVVLDKAWSDRQ